MSKWIFILLLGISILILLVCTASMIGRSIFVIKANKQVDELFKRYVETNNQVIKKGDLEKLPLPVKNWLMNSRIIGKEKIITVRLKQQGPMRTQKDGPWMESNAEQYFRLDEPSFVWKANVKMAPFLYLSGIDTFKDGKGKMKILFLSLFSVVESEGPEMDTGTMMRFLAEMPWFPIAALNSYIQWEEINDSSAKATMTNKGISVSGIFYFNENGDIIKFIGKRYREVSGDYVLSDWGGSYKEYKVFEGIRIPSKSDIFWVEEAGEFKWFKCEITEIEYNKPLLY
jgi:hypothetical protein